MANKQELTAVLAKRQAILQGDAGRIANQRAAGKLTARERIAKLLDQGSFVELDTLVSKNNDYAGVVTGYGTVQDRPVYLFAQDQTVHGGAMGVQQAAKICKVLDLALKTGTPVIAMCDSAGVRLDEGAEAMGAYANVYAKMAKMSGVCPMIALVLGEAIGAAALIAQVADVAIESEATGELLVCGPQVFNINTGKTFDEINKNKQGGKIYGGASVMAKQGAVALTAADEDAAIALAVQVLDYLPDSNMDSASVVDTDDMNRILPEIAAEDASALMAAMADNGVYTELHAEYGKDARVALARIGGRSCGIVVTEGEMTPEGCTKAARFVRFCDCYSLPVVSMINSCGVAVPAPEAQARTMTASAKLLCAYAEATTTKVTVVVGDAIGQAYVAMGGKANADVTYAWPGAVISALKPAAAVAVLKSDAIKNGADRAELEDEFAANVADGVAAAQAGMIDDVIEPAQTRKYVISAMEMLDAKRESNPPKKHGNLPL